jgi:hypothetical protein
VKVGDLVYYRGDRSAIGMIIGLYTSATFSGREVDYWHVFWLNDGSDHWNPKTALTHEDEYDIDKLFS